MAFVQPSVDTVTVTLSVTDGIVVSEIMWWIGWCVCDVSVSWYSVGPIYCATGQKLSTTEFSCQHRQQRLPRRKFTFGLKNNLMRCNATCHLMAWGCSYDGWQFISSSRRYCDHTNVLISVPSLGVYYLLSLTLSVCHKHCFFFFVSGWNRVISWPSVLHDKNYKTFS